MCSVFTVLVLLMTVAVAWLRREPIIARSQWTMQVLIGVGSALALSSVFLLAGPPSHLNCFVQPALFDVAFTLLFGTLALKTWRIYRVFAISLKSVTTTNDSGKPVHVTITNYDLYRYLMFMVCIDLVLLTFRFTISSPRPEVALESKPPFGDVTVLRCSPADVRLEMITIAWKVLVAGVLLFYAFKTRHVIEEYGEARYIFIAANQMATCCLIYFGVVGVLNNNAEAAFIFQSFGTMAVVATTAACVLGRKVAHVLFQFGVSPHGMQEFQQQMAVRDTRETVSTQKTDRNCGRASPRKPSCQVEPTDSRPQCLAKGFSAYSSGGRNSAEDYTLPASIAEESLPLVIAHPDFVTIDTASVRASMRAPTTEYDNVDECLKDEHGKAALLEFSRAEFSAENVEFLFAVDEFTDHWDSWDATSRKERFDFIVAEFLQAKAPREVCVGDSVSKKIVEATVPWPEIFDDARKSAARTLEQDIFPRFLESIRRV